MSYITSGLLSVVAVSATLGAVQLASGQDAAAQIRAGHAAFANASSLAVAASPDVAINRSGKGDRANATGSIGRSQTISINTTEATSVLVRIPMASADKRPVSPSLLKPVATGRAPVACEPVVSALTEVARMLGPGRCVT